MNAIDLIRRLFQHRAWVNQNLLTTADTLTEDQLRQSFEIGQGSVWKSLFHLYAAEYVWLGALKGDEDPRVPGDLPNRLPGNQLGDVVIKNLAELKSAWNDQEARWTEYLHQLTPESLTQTIYKKSTSVQLGQRFGTSCSDILLHVCTHAQYTSAQIINMLRQLEVTQFPHTMLIILARQDSQSTTSLN